MKKSYSLRKQLNILLTIIVILQSLVLVFVLLLAQVFNLLDAESIKIFNNTTVSQAEFFNKETSKLIYYAIDATESITNSYNELSDRFDVSEKEFYLSDGVGEEAALVAGEVLVSTLRDNRITGAFIVLENSYSSQGSSEEYSAIYLRNATPDESVENSIQMEIGTSRVATELDVTLSSKWKLNVKKNENISSFDFYDKPTAAAKEYKKYDLMQYGYWSIPTDFLNDNQTVVTYTIPLLNDEGEPYGVFGVEIELSYLAQYYMSSEDLFFSNSFFAIAPVENGIVDLTWFFPGNHLARTYLSNYDSLQLDAGSDENLYSTTLTGLGDTDCSIYNVKIYSDNTVYTAEKLSLICFVQDSVLRENSTQIRQIIARSFVITTIFAVIAVLLLVYFYTKRMDGLSEYVKKLAPYDSIKFEQTGMREIDDLMSAVEVFNQSLFNAAETKSKILELSLLPIGVYEVMEKNENVVLTEFLYKILHIDKEIMLTKDKWEKLQQVLLAEKSPENENVYRYVDAMEEKEYWLRILEAQSPQGVVGVILDVTEEIIEKQKLNNQLDFDQLTWLLSLTAFKRNAIKKIENEPDALGALITIDLDNLKYINDNFGHEYGDRLIIAASDIFRYFEQFDGVISRTSGDEFAIYIHGYQEKESMKEVIAGLSRYASTIQLQLPNGNKNTIRYSTGVAYYPEDATEMIELMRLSDFAMYEAKHNEKGSLYEFDRTQYQKMSYLLENRETINKLLDEHLIRFAFQPIVDIKTGEIYAYEALMRSKLDSFRSPLEILSVAAAQSKLYQLERVVAIEVLKAIDANCQAIGNRKIFINSIPNQYVTEDEYTGVKDLYKKYSSQIVIEIIEKNTRDENILKDKVKSIRAEGILVAIDDFGSGYSNEIRLLALMPDIVKLDMELIQGIHRDQDKQSMVKGIIEFAKKKEIKIIAEGVEEKEDLLKVIELGVDYVQGYYFAKPSFDFNELNNLPYLEKIKN